MNIVCRKTERSERRQHGKRLRWPRVLARDGRGGNIPLVDGIKRFSCQAIKDKDHVGLSGDGDRRNRTSKSEQHRLRRGVVVPQVVMH